MVSCQRSSFSEYISQYILNEQKLRENLILMKNRGLERILSKTFSFYWMIREIEIHRRRERSTREVSKRVYGMV